MVTAAPPPPTGSIVFDHISLDGQREQLYRERADGTAVVKVTRGGRYWFEPRWLSDGTIASFGGRGLRIVTVDGRLLRQIVIHRSTTRLEISPDGVRFAYVEEGCIDQATHGEAGCGTLWVRRLDGGGQHRLSPPEAVDVADAFVGNVYTWSPDGRRVAYVGFSGLVVVDVVSGRRHLIGPTRYLTASPDWSPDGRRIVYVHGSSIVTVDPDGSHRRFVAPFGAAAFLVQWSPDGRRIAWLTGDDRHGGWAVFTVDPDGSHRARSGLAHDYQTLVWSPDSRWLLVGGSIGERYRILPADGVGRVWSIPGGDHLDWRRSPRSLR